MKKPSRNIKSVLPLLFVLTLSSCGRIKLKNSEWCGDMGELGASCFKTHSDESRDLSKEQWDQERFGQVCTQAENFTNMKTAIQKLCYLTKKCTFEEKKILKELESKIETFNKGANDYATSILTP